MQPASTRSGSSRAVGPVSSTAPVGTITNSDDGSHIDVMSGPVWCYRCHDFVGGESIESLETIEQQLADLQNPRSELYRLTKDTLPTADGRPRFRPHYIDLLTGGQRRRWREGRDACRNPFECGSTEIVVLPADEIRVEDPGWHRLGRCDDHGPLQHSLQQPLLHRGRRPSAENTETDVLDVALIREA